MDVSINKNLLDDNQKFQEELWVYRKVGCANQDHINFYLNQKETNEKFEHLTKQIESLKGDLSKYKSTIIDDGQYKILNDWVDNKKSWNFVLLYRASENEFSVSSFHEKCDNKGPTITVIKTTSGDVFGGYNSQAWKSEGGAYGDKKCFIFTLVNKHGIKPTKYLYDANDRQGRYVYADKSFGPVFGWRDIVIHQDKEKSYQEFPFSFIDTTEQSKTTLSSRLLSLQDYEVFGVL
ncbi:hypothetical protein CYY_002956 [Polysphondylium violaceum]|uniref:TLDc domain-containing protein n=1 Tax=Polysphondylium violaceum TaxID=133409 RepID=A0A8J4Q0U3_9MYCE|nr:hypothetical protein CYY_002956 [Polysphondylium violaceum]